MKLLVLLNPQAHGGRAGQALAGLRQKLRDHGIDAQVEKTDAPGAAMARVGQLEAGQFDVVAAAGGDGTLFEVVNGLMAQAPEHRAALAVLPMGTGNAFARDLGLVPGAVDPAIELLRAGSASPVDVAEVRTPSDHFYFINMLGLGLVTEAARTAAQFKWLGRGAYTLGALSALVSLPVSRLGIELDGVALPAQDSLFLQVANTRYTGTHFKMAPEARMNDGLLDIVLVDALSRRRALRLFPAIYDGRHIEAKEVSVSRASRIRISSSTEMGCAVDGEFRGTTPLSIRCIPGALTLLGL